MAAPSTIANGYETHQEEENEQARPWLAVIVILLAIGLYLTVDIQKRRLRHPDSVIVAQQER